MEYEYKKVKGYEQKKFVENGHTMLEEDVLQRLKRLAYLEEQLKQANEADTSHEQALNIADVSESEFVECFCKLLKNDLWHKDGDTDCFGTELLTQYTKQDDREKASQLYKMIHCR